VKGENGNLEEHSEDLGIDGKMVFHWISREIEWEGVTWMRVSGYEPVVDSYKHGNELSGSIKNGEFLD
jgi:hypothetical protein